MRDVKREDFLVGKHMPEGDPGYPAEWETHTKPYLTLLNAIGRHIKPLRLMYITLDPNHSNSVDFSLGVATLIKHVRETLDFWPNQYSDEYIEHLARPFGEILHGRMVLRHKDFTDAIKRRFALTRLATNNKAAALPKEVMRSILE